MKELACSIVEDLLPLYVEDMISATTKDAVAMHLSSCPSCQKKAEAMQNKPEISPLDTKDAIKPLRHFRKRLFFILIGIPIWFPLLLTASILLLLGFLCFWIVLIALWSVPLALCVAAIASIAQTMIAFAGGLPSSALLGIASFAVCLGLGLAFFPLLRWLTKIFARITRWLAGKLHRIIFGF